MASVNLLPPEMRIGRGTGRRLVYPMLFLVLLSAFAGFYLHLDSILGEQAEQRLELQTSIAALQPIRVQREYLMRLESELQAVVREFERRITWSLYTDELAARIPAGVALSELRLDGQRVTMLGSAENLSQIAQLISNLTASEMYAEPAVGQISIGVPRVDFQASVMIIQQKGMVPR